METKANYAIVGFFTVLVIAAAFGFVYWMSQYGRTGQMVELVVNIPGSANGLSVGSPVRFNGINVGSVRNLAIDANDPRYSIAITEVSADAPVMKSTTATLEVQGLTGAAYIELSGGRKGTKTSSRPRWKRAPRRISLPISRASPACWRPRTRSSTERIRRSRISKASSPTSVAR